MTNEKKSDVISQLKAAEMSLAERKAGLSIATLEDPNFPKVDLLGALAWVYTKREDQNLKFEDFMADKTLEDLTEILGLVDADEEGK